MIRMANDSDDLLCGAGISGQQKHVALFGRFSTFSPRSGGQRSGRARHGERIGLGWGVLGWLSICCAASTEMPFHLSTEFYLTAR